MSYGFDPAPGEIVVPVKLTLKREQEFEFMPDQGSRSARIAFETTWPGWLWSVWTWIGIPLPIRSTGIPTGEVGYSWGGWTTWWHRRRLRRQWGIH